MKKFIFVILFLLALGVVLVATCPDRTAHREANKGIISEVVNSEMNKNPLGSTEIISIGTVFTMDLVDAYLKSNTDMCPKKCCIRPQSSKCSRFSLAHYVSISLSLFVLRVRRCRDRLADRLS